MSSSRSTWKYSSTRCSSVPERVEGPADGVELLGVETSPFHCPEMRSLHSLMRWARGLRGRGGHAPFRQVLAGIDVQPQSVQGDRLHQTALDRGVDVEARGLGDRLVLGIEHRMDLREGDALDRDCDLDEMAAVALEIGQSLEAPDFPSSLRISQAQLRHGEGPGEIGERALALDVLGHVHLVEKCEVVLHDRTPKRKRPRETVAGREEAAIATAS